MTTKRNVKNASIMSGAVLLAVMFGYQAVSGGNLEGPGRQVWKDEPTITVKLSNGQETVLKHVGIGMRAGTPGTWKNYLDPKDTLSDAMTYPESPNEALVPVYALSQYALEPEKLDRRDADPPGSSYNSPFLHSIGAQRNSLIRFTLARQFDVDIFTAGARTKMAANGFPSGRRRFLERYGSRRPKGSHSILNAYRRSAGSIKVTLSTLSLNVMKIGRVSRKFTTPSAVAARLIAFSTQQKLPDVWRTPKAARTSSRKYTPSGTARTMMVPIRACQLLARRSSKVTKA